MLAFNQHTLPSTTYAADYVLPYPSYMPGHKLYKMHQAWEKLQEYWHFGNIAKFKYYLSMSDKYLVEAKTLFEYKQYLLAVKALENSKKYFSECEIYLTEAQQNGKDVSQKRDIYKQAGIKHREILDDLKNKLPKKVIWKEENSLPVELEIHKSLMTTTTNVRQ